MHTLGLFNLVSYYIAVSIHFTYQRINRANFVYIAIPKLSIHACVCVYNFTKLGNLAYKDGIKSLFK